MSKRSPPSLFLHYSGIIIFPRSSSPASYETKKHRVSSVFPLPLSVLICFWSPASSRWLPGFFFCLTMYKIRNERSWFYTLESYTLKVHRLSFWLVGFWEIARNHKFRIWKRPPGRESADTAHNSQVLPGFSHGLHFFKVSAYLYNEKRKPLEPLTGGAI